MIKQRFAALLDKEMDRRSFLIHVAAGVVALVGASAVARALSGNQSGTQRLPKPTSQAHGYGGSPYGR